VAPWIPVLKQHTVFTKRVFNKFTLVWYSTKQGTTHRPTSYLVSFIHGPFFGCEKHTDGSTFGLMISLASVCYGNSRVAKPFLHPHLVLNQCGFGAILALFCFLSQLPHQN